MEMQEKVCVVTGGANGIGRCLVESFSAAGASVVFADTDAGTWGQAGGAPASCRFLYMGILQRSRCFISCPILQARFQRADVLVNNACVSRGGILSGCGYDDFDYVLRLGVVAPYRLTMLLRPLFAPGASVVNISSYAGVDVPAGYGKLFCREGRNPLFDTALAASSGR